MTQAADGAESEYEVLAEGLADLGSRLTIVLTELLAEERVAVHAITPCVKARQSAMKKINKEGMQGRSLGSLTDLLGIRVITYFEDGVDAAAQAVENDFDIHWDKSVDKRALLEDDRFGYQSIHYIAEMSQARTDLSEYKKYKGKVFEIQIRSMLQHAWAEIEHDLGYKTERAIPAPVRRRFSRLAGLLEMADEEFAAIRDALKAHRASARTAVATSGTAAIDQDSLVTLIKTSEEIGRVDAAIISALAGELATRLPAKAEYAGHRAAEMSALGLKDTAEIVGKLTVSQDELLNFVRCWARLNSAPEHGAQSVDERIHAASSPVAELNQGAKLAGASSAESGTGLPAGISLRFLYLRERGAIALASLRTSGRWAEEVSMTDRSLVDCLSTAMGQGSLPLGNTGADTPEG